jgi:sugar O-acyltransferase (sialic acid O-acetyltransferase NeuD family)
MRRNIIIYGAGGAGRTLAHYLTLGKNSKTVWKVNGFIDDTEGLQGKEVNKIPVLGGFEYLKDYKGNVAVTIVEKPEVRRNLILKIKKNNKVRFPILIISTSIASPFIEWGEGCILTNPYNVVSVNVKVGDFVYFGGGNRIGPDVAIGDYTIIYTGVIFDGGVIVGSGCVIGSGVVILPRVKIGDGSIIGAGSVVTKDIPSKVVAAGNPAEVIKKIKAH